MVSNGNDEPHFDVDDELDDHMMDEENMPVDEDIWIDDDEGNVALDLASRVEDEVRPPTFKETYVRSVHDIIGKVDSLIKRSVWSGREVVTHPPALDVDIDVVLQVLRKISPLIGDHLKIDSSNIRKHPEIQKVLKNHTRGSAYFRQYFKIPLVANCDCAACKLGMLFVWPRSLPQLIHMHG